MDFKIFDLIKENYISIASFSIGLLFVLWLHGAVPFFAIPTLAQAVWTTGFSQSFINQSVASIYATNFGCPQPTPITFGLAGAYPAGLFIALGMHSADAYSLMVMFWLTVAFGSAYYIAIRFKLDKRTAVLASVLWLCLPITWRHCDYSMVSLGIALLTFYFSAVITLFAPIHLKYNIKKAILYIIACLIAVFMDGYTFVMFAVGASIIGGVFFLIDKEKRKYLLKYAFPIHLFGFGIAYFMYTTYIGIFEFPGAHLDFFRAWGVDLTFLIIPSQGVHCLWDILGLSIKRTGNDFFGDASVWITTFSFPLIIAGGISWWLIRKKHKIAYGLLIVCLFSFFMAMGPSLKINSKKPKPMSDLMPAEYAIIPTGSGIISGYVPGFKNMRASYRWVALGLFCLWALLIIALAENNKAKAKWITSTILLMLIVSFLPNLINNWQNKVKNREKFFEIDKDLISEISCDLNKGDMVVFLPYRNDFMINYLASSLNIRTYNIGGDKNLTIAKKNWPIYMRTFTMGKVGDNFNEKVLLLLLHEDADVVVIPYIDMLWAAYIWPPTENFKKELQTIILKFKKSSIVDITEKKYYSIIRLKKDSDRKFLLEKLMSFPLFPPFALNKKYFSESILSQVGRINNGKVISTGKRGFLIYGPYVSMQANKYQFTLKGKGVSVNDAWGDIVSSKGKVNYLKFKLNPTSESNDILAEGQLTIDKSINDLEIRIYVGEKDSVSIKSYELIPFKKSTLKIVQ